MSEYLSPHFTLEEMIFSNTAKAKKISNIPTAEHKRNLKYLCETLLEKIRFLLGSKYGCEVSIRINSGYRGPTLNKAVGGVPTSEHCRGSAADFVCYKVVNKVKVKIPVIEVYDSIKAWVRGGHLSVNQLIYEVSGSSVWCHVSCNPAGIKYDKKQFLKYKNGKYFPDK